MNIIKKYLKGKKNKKKILKNKKHFFKKKGGFLKDLIIVLPYVIKTMINLRFLESILILRIIHVTKIKNLHKKNKKKNKANSITSRL